MLIIFGGLPGTGKTTLSRALVRHLGAVHVRIDTIEQALAKPGTDIGEAGYVVGYAIAEDNLRLGRTVIADSVNPLAVTRQAWRAVAGRTGAPYVEIEVVCSNPDEHRRRIETRTIADTTPLTWTEVTGRSYEPWPGPHAVVDTAGRTPEDCLTEVIAALAATALPREITVAVPADVPAIARLVASAYGPYIERIGKPPAPMLADYESLVGERAVSVLRAGVDIIGLIVLLPQPDHLLIENVAVAPSRQGRGLGRDLIAHAEREAARRGYGEVRLHTNALMHENLRLYARLGYVEIGRGEEAGYARVFLRKRLA